MRGARARKCDRGLDVHEHVDGHLDDRDSSPRSGQHHDHDDAECHRDHNVGHHNRHDRHHHTDHDVLGSGHPDHDDGRAGSLISARQQ